MASRKKTYRNIDEIVDFVTNDSDSNDDMFMGEEDDESESDWEYQEEPKQVPQNSGTVSDPRPDNDETVVIDETVVNVVDVDDVVMSDGSSSSESALSKSTSETDTESSDDESLAKIACRNVGVRGHGPRTRGGRGAAVQQARGATSTRRGAAAQGARGVRARGGRGTRVPCRGRARGGAAAQARRGRAVGRQGNARVPARNANRLPPASWKKVDQHYFIDLQENPDQPKNHRIPQGEDFVRLTGRHFPKLKQPTDGALNQHPSKICKVCYAKGLRTNKGHPLRTTFVCGDCPSEPGLHADRCFEIYHTKRNYAEDAA